MFVGFLGKRRVREKERGEGQGYVFWGKPRKGIGLLAFAKWLICAWSFTGIATAKEIFYDKNVVDLPDKFAELIYVESCTILHAGNYHNWEPCLVNCILLFHWQKARITEKVSRKVCAVWVLGTCDLENSTQQKDVFVALWMWRSKITFKGSWQGFHHISFFLPAKRLSKIFWLRLVSWEQGNMKIYLFNIFQGLQYSLFHILCSMCASPPLSRSLSVRLGPGCSGQLRHGERGNALWRKYFCR